MDTLSEKENYIYVFLSHSVHPHNSRNFYYIDLDKEAYGYIDMFIHLCNYMYLYAFIAGTNIHLLLHIYIIYIYIYRYTDI